MQESSPTIGGMLVGILILTSEFDSISSVLSTSQLILIVNVFVRPIYFLG